MRSCGRLGAATSTDRATMCIHVSVPVKAVTHAHVSPGLVNWIRFCPPPERGLDCTSSQALDSVDPTCACRGFGGATAFKSVRSAAEIAVRSATPKPHLIAIDAQALALVAPAEMMAAMQSPAEAALTGTPQDADRPATLAAAEILSGLLASGAPYAGTSAFGCQRL